ncbi:VanZ family protein [Halalkaliarchaeum desulfuricum]|uniref:VanZ family protein n=1 Tax=Halalkaliarchaeum desulfuricum TaxID=2055893 RepID=A0A343TN78_9EURY|nr:VanZ family protein [Halalkaliarchaeum desulfuricum]AUX10550.1 VanZ family protein [Halalkaliarchaeum desulfuricum]
MRPTIPLLPRPIRWTAVAAVAGLILYASLLSPPPETIVDDARPWFSPLSYWRHFVAYCTLAGTLAYATDHWRLPRWRHAALVIAIAASYGILMEFGQVFVPERTHFMVADVIVNTLGASLVLVWFLVRPSLELTPIGKLLDRVVDDPAV